MVTLGPPYHVIVDTNFINFSIQNKLELRRIRKVPGVPIMFIVNHKYTIERLPDAYGAPKPATK
ncbi:rRNA-processing protein fcf1 [Dipsacomyces acuminosporus]|nr:rRNA-processing protein fcf1 [Dipsacomyces acuminosporus]